MRISSFILAFIILFSIPVVAKNYEIVYSKQDSILVNDLLKDYLHKNSQNGKMIYFGERLLGVPYVPYTLEQKEDENLIINLHELDCTTFVETVLALSLSAKQENPGFQTFASQLKLIRYTNGEIKGYASRLHYFSDWITDNSSKGVIKEITGEIRGASKGILNLGFMSDHPDKYVPLSKNPRLITDIYNREQSLNGKPYFYIDKKNMTSDIIRQIRKGDIIAVTTNIAGLDISHVGIAYPAKDNLYLLHASQQKGQVIIDVIPLDEYLRESNRSSGIRIIRPLL